MRRIVNIRSKLAGVAFALVVAVVCALTAYFSTTEVDTAEDGLGNRATGYARILANEAESAIAFNDTETAHEVLEAASLDPDVHSVFLYRADGTVLGGIGPNDGAPAPVTTATMQRTEAFISVTAPVVSHEGRRGTLVVVLSTDRIEKNEAREIRGAILAGTVALAIALVISWLIGGSFAKRIQRIQRATHAFAKGHLDEPPIVDGSRDEIGQLAGSFNAMSARIRDLVEVIASDGREEAARLDALVVERTTELRATNEDLRFLLQHVDQGFMTVDRAGRLVGQRSAVLDEWFTAPEAGKSLWDYIGAGDLQARRWLAVSWETLFDGMLPLDLVLDQLPKEIRQGDATFGIRYQPIAVNAVVEKVIVVVSDISDEIARRRAEARQKELASVFGQFIADAASVEQFITEGSTLVRSILASANEDPDLVIVKRALHTLKGNAAFLGLFRLSALAHEIESHIEDFGEPPTASALAQLELLWSELVNTVQPFVLSRADRISLSRENLDAHETAIRAGVSRAELLDEIHSWLLEPTLVRLQRAAEQARTVADRLGKPLVVDVEDNRVRVEPHTWAPLWASLVHVVRNAVDHGIEDAETRRQAGKPAAGRLVLRTLESGNAQVIEIADDGGGIDWDALRERAAHAGLAGDLSAVDLLFADGISTKSEVTELSGRGVGLAAMRATCLAMGGHVTVESTRGRGTTFRFAIPLAIAPGPTMVPPSTSVAA